MKTQTMREGTTYITLSNLDEWWNKNGKINLLFWAKVYFITFLLSEHFILGKNVLYLLFSSQSHDVEFQKFNFLFYFYTEKQRRIKWLLVWGIMGMWLIFGK